MQYRIKCFGKIQINTVHSYLSLLPIILVTFREISQANYTWSFTSNSKPSIIQKSSVIEMFEYIFLNLFFLYLSYYAGHWHLYIVQRAISISLHVYWNDICKVSIPRDHPSSHRLFKGSVNSVPHSFNNHGNILPSPRDLVFSSFFFSIMLSLSFLTIFSSNLCPFRWYHPPLEVVNPRL